MKESIAQAFILNLILFFFVILVLLLFGSINYSKAFKVKNRIINIIEKHGQYADSGVERTNIQNEIDENMVKAGYGTTNTDLDKCMKFIEDDNGLSEKLVYPLESDSTKYGGRYYDYCIIRHSVGKIVKTDTGQVDNDGEKVYEEEMQNKFGEYYQVIVYMKFEIPVIGGFLEFPVRGETKLLYDNFY